MCSLPRSAKVSTVHSVVSIARSAAASADSAVGWPAAAVLHVGGDAGRWRASPGAPARRCRPKRGPASGGPSRPGAISHTTRSPMGSWSSSPIGRPATSNTSSVSSRWSGSRKPATGLTVQRRVDLVDPRLGRLGHVGRGRPGGTATGPAGANRGRRRSVPGRPGELVAGRDRRRGCGRQIERAPERVEQAGAGEADGAGDEGQWRTGGRRGNEHTVGVTGAVLPVDRHARVDGRAAGGAAVEGGRDQVESFDGGRQVGQRLLDVIGHVARAAGGPSRARPRRRGSRAPPTPACGPRRWSSRVRPRRTIVVGGPRPWRRQARGRRRRAASRRASRPASVSASHSSHSGTHGCDHIGHADRRGLRPCVHRVPQDLVGHVGLRSGTCRSRAPNAAVVPSYTASFPNRIAASASIRRRIVPWGRPDAAPRRSRQPPPVVRRVQHGLLGEVGAPPSGWRRCPGVASTSVPRRRPSMPCSTWCGQRHHSSPSRRGATVVAVAQAAVGALHADHRVEREQEPRRRPGHDSGLGRDRRFALAAVVADDRVDVLRADHQPPVEEQARQHGALRVVDDAGSLLVA